MSEKIEKAIELFKNRDYEGAIDAFSCVLETEPDNAEIHNNMGVAYANLDDMENAEKHYLKALELNPKLVQGYINLVDIYYKQKDYLAAINLLLQGEYELPDEVILAHYLARVYIEDARLDLAIDELDKVLEKQPENYDAYYDLGRVNFELGNYEDAISNFENVLEYKENNEHLFFYLAQAYEANDEIDKAISNYMKALAVNSDFYPAYKKLGVLFLARNEMEDAIEYFEDYLKFDLPEEEKESIKKLIERLKKQ